MLPPFAKKVYKGTNRPNQQSIKVVEDWLSNQPENKLREDSWEHWLQLEFPWQSAYYQKCLVPDFELIERHQKKRKKEVSGFHPHKHMVEGQYPYYPPPFYGGWE